MRQNILKYAWLIVILLATTLACQLVSDLGKTREKVETIATEAKAGANILGTARALVTQVGGSQMLKTVQALATEAGESGLLQTAIAVATEEGPSAIETVKAFATQEGPALEKTAQAFARILNAAGANYAVLGRSEQCTGDPARRAGREDIFFGLASANVEILNEVAPKRIVTTCPHCLHTIKNEYPAFGGNYTVIHHTQFINELVGAGKIHYSVSSDQYTVTFHDPCYLGRHNGILESPRQALKDAGVVTIEMPRNERKSFCCGAGGAQMWKEEEEGTERVNTARFREAKATGASTVAVGCPFCMTMLTDASTADGGSVQVRDVAEIVAERLQ